MGATESVPIVNIDFPCMCIYFSSYDKLILLHSDQGLINFMRMLLRKYWSKGIQREEMKDGAISFKLFGYPFKVSWSDTDLESLEAQTMCGAILKELLAQGWVLVASSDLSRSSTLERTAWFFSRSVPINTNLTNAPMPNFTVSRSDRLIFQHISPQMRNDLVNLIGRAYRKGIQEILPIHNDSMRVKLYGYPWREKWNLENEARPLLLELITYFEHRGLFYYGNASLQGETDTVYFVPFSTTFRVNPPLEPVQENRYFGVGLDRDDRLRLLNCPDLIINGIVEKTILQFWRKGIRKKTQVGFWHEFKLAGYPWCATGTETVESRVLLTQLFQSLHANGWAVIAALDTSRALDDTSFLIFRTTPPRSMLYMCISLNSSDKIRLLNAPKDAIEAIQNAISTFYTYGIQEVRDYAGYIEFKLCGYPWGGGSNYAKHGRQLMMFLLDLLIKHGFGFAVSADVSAKYYSGNENSSSHKEDVHSWWLARPNS